MKYLALAAWISTILAANFFIAHVGDCSRPGPCTVPVWPGLDAPSGVLWIGLAFTLRDLVQNQLGRAWMLGGVAAGALLSAGINPALAIASGAAFLVSELADFAVYTPLRARTWLGAVAASNTVGLVVDSALFLLLAFGSLDFLAGQVVGKLEMTIAAIALLALVRSFRPAPARRYAA